MSGAAAHAHFSASVALFNAAAAAVAGSRGASAKALSSSRAEVFEQTKGGAGRAERMRVMHCGGV